MTDRSAGGFGRGDHEPDDHGTDDPESDDRAADDQVIAVWGRLRSLVQNNDRRRLVSTALGMSFIRTKALRRLAAGPLSMRDLADELATDRPYTSVFVDDLEQRGLVRRVVDPSDRRGKIVSLTAEGRRLAARAEEILDSPPVRLRRLPAAELATLERILDRLE